MAITTKELYLVKDNVKNGQNMVNFVSACREVASDPSVKNVFQSIAAETQRDVQVLAKHILNGVVQ